MKQDSIDKNMKERVGNLFKMFMYLIWHLEKGKSPCEDRLNRWHEDKGGAEMSVKVEICGKTVQIDYLDSFGSLVQKKRRSGRKAFEGKIM